MSSDFGWHQYPRLQKIRKLTFGLMAALPDSDLPRKVAVGAKFKIQNQKCMFLKPNTGPFGSAEDTCMANMKQM